MKELTTLIPALGGLFSSDAWLSAVNWAFWFLLIVIAAGGLIYATLGKNSLLNRSICGTVNLAVIYLAVIGMYYIIPSWRNMATELPFLSVDQDTILLVNPFSLSLKAAVPVLTRFMILTFLIHCTETLCHSSRSLLTWFFWQLLAAGSSWAIYSIICIGLNAISPALLSKWAIVPLGIFWGLFVLYWLARFIVKVFTPDNKTFKSVNSFLVSNKAGSALSKTALTTSLCAALLWWINELNYNKIPFAKFDLFAVALIGLMFMVTLYLFSMVFADKKAAKKDGEKKDGDKKK